MIESWQTAAPFTENERNEKRERVDCKPFANEKGRTMTTQKGVARYTDLEGTPFEVFEVPDKADQSLVVIDPSTHPFGFLLQHRQFEDPELTWSGEIEREVVAKLLRMDENAEVWADAWGWWALDVYDRCKREGTLPKPKKKRRRSA